MDSELRQHLARVRRRWFRLVAMRTIGRATAAAAVPPLAAILVDRLLAPSGPALILLGAFTMAASIAAAAAAAWRMQRRPDDRRVARFVEERTPLDDAVVSAVEMSERPADARGAFGDLIVGQAVARLRGIDVAAIIPGAALRRSAAEACAGVVLLAVALGAGLPGLRRAADTAWVALFPETIQVVVLPGDTRVVAGQPLRIRATIQGRGSALGGVTPSLTVSAGGDQRTVAMSPDGDAFAFAFESVDRSFQYQVRAASAASKTYAVTALFPPRVRRIDVRYDYPSFTGLKTRQEEDGGDVYGPAGTRVRLRIHTDKPVTDGSLALAAGPAVALRPAGEQLVDADLVLSKDDSYRIRLADADGLRSTGDTEYFIRLMDDRPPEVRVLRPAADQGITPLEEIAIEARADDDYGISSFDLVYSVAGRGERRVPFTTVSGTGVAKIGSHLLAAEELQVQPGDVITYYARARDVGRGKPPTETRSDIFFLEVKPFGEEFVAAQSQAMGGGASGTQIDSLIAAQKEIINATWNLERRAVAGRSVEDMKAVAQAQAELRTRAQQLAGMGRRGGRNPLLPQQLGPSSQPPRRQGAADPVAAAIEAMGRAVQHLEGQRTKDAIPDEMKALQGLLQAQAEVRRRQVMQQSASGAGQGGSNRQEQDLSALFDRELQRQQRTNYETRSQIEERPDQRETGSALDRIKDLARRQEDLSRRQRELANANLSAEELKRQLETLTREQMELRQQVEELAKQMQGQQGAEGSKGSDGSAGARGSQSGQGSQQQSMRDASEQMRNSASEMRRQDANAAAERAQHAADQLRRLEQQVQGTGRDARQRAAGELQMEAQQVAEAQRRVAAESARLQQDGQRASADAMRRLAAEKDTLADRVDELQRAAQQLATAGGRAPDTSGRASAAREAAGQLQREQVGQRMRAGANAMRGAAAAGGQSAEQTARREADADRQLARTLDRVADTLGGADQADARQLAERLDQTAGIRERLNRLEQQIREAEARQRSSEAARTQPGQDGRQGREGRGGTTGSGQAGELERLREQYARELQRARETLGRLTAEQQRGGGGSTPEHHEFSRSAPGTESFKQDFSRWASLRKDIDLALERYEAAASERLARKDAGGRLSAGGSDRVPEAYRRPIARYYESLAKVKK